MQVFVGGVRVVFSGPFPVGTHKVQWAMKSDRCDSRQELSNEYLVAKSGFDRAEHRSLKVCPA